MFRLKRGSRSTKSYRQSRHTAMIKVCVIPKRRQRRSQRNSAESFRDCKECNFQLQTRQHGTQAKMQAKPKGQVGPGWPLAKF